MPGVTTGGCGAISGNALCHEDREEALVCGMAVAEDAPLQHRFEGVTYRFCSEHCLQYPFFDLLFSLMTAATAMSFSSVSVITNALRLRHISP